MANKHGKKYERVAALVDADKLYEPTEAADLVKKTSYVKFDPTLEVHMRLGIDPRHADQMVRGTAILPHGTGKPVRILVFAAGEAERIALDAGADFVGRRRPDPPDRGRLVRLRCRHRHAGHDGPGG